MALVAIQIAKNLCLAKDNLLDVSPTIENTKQNIKRKKTKYKKIKYTYALIHGDSIINIIDESKLSKTHRIQLQPITRANKFYCEN